MMSTMGMIRDGSFTTGQLNVGWSEDLNAMRDQPSAAKNEDDMSMANLLTINGNDLLRDMTSAKPTITITTNNETGLPRSTEVIVVELQTERKAHDMMTLFFIVLSPANVRAPSLRMNLLGLPNAPGIANVVMIDVT